MIKILEEGQTKKVIKLIYTIRCPHCGAKFECEVEDFTSIEKTLFGAKLINCPCCNREINATDSTIKTNRIANKEEEMNKKDEEMNKKDEEAKQRVLEERKELFDRVMKLEAFIDNQKAVSKIGKTSADLLCVQLHIMRSYGSILTTRLQNWGK